MRLLFICFFIILGIVFSWGQGSNNSLSDDNYSGYRIYLSNPKVLSSKKSSFKIKFRTTNTGSKAISPNLKSEIKNQLIVKFDDQLEQTDVNQYRDLIVEKIKSTKLDLKNGGSKIIEYKIKIPKERRNQGASFKLNTGDKAPNYSRKLCPDLVLDSLVLLKRDKKYAYVKFRISNQGKGFVNVIGEKTLDDNIVVGAFFSGSRKFSRGAIPADYIHLKGLEKTKGILFPGDSMEVEMKVSRKKQSKYVKVLIVFVDSSQMILECNETNNRASVVVK